MVKKLIAVGATAGAVLLVAAGVAFASDHHRSRGGWTANVGIVYDNNVGAIANTGLNRQEGRGDQDMDTGDAIATAGQDIVVNSSTCGCEEGRRGRGRNLNFGLVAGNDVWAVANTGGNSQTGGSNGPAFQSEGEEGRRRHHGNEQDMDTGDADAYAWQTVLVNSSADSSEAE